MVCADPLAYSIFAEAIGGHAFYKPLRTVLFGIGAAAVVMALVSWEARGRLSVPRWLAFLGDASYAIYLVHITAMGVAARLLQMVAFDSLPPYLLAIVLSASAVLAGAVAHVLVEKPVIALIRGQIRRRRLTTEPSAH
ncbi:acyltransferase [Palleronia rufa]